MNPFSSLVCVKAISVKLCSNPEKSLSFWAFDFFVFYVLSMCFLSCIRRFKWAELHIAVTSLRVGYNYSLALILPWRDEIFSASTSLPILSNLTYALQSYIADGERDSPMSCWDWFPSRRSSLLRELRQPHLLRGTRVVQHPRCNNKQNAPGRNLHWRQREGKLPLGFRSKLKTPMYQSD